VASHGQLPETVNGTELLIALLCNTRALPVFAPDATVATICVSLQLTTLAGCVPNQTRPLPCVAPKPFPAIVTCAPTAAEVGVRLVMFGSPAAEVTVKVTPLLV
jgi:hypothetical protein